jgi:hypothetical protein
MIRNGYPDMFVSLLYDRGVYNEENGTKGVIDDIQLKNYPVLTQDFYTTGVSFTYGMQNKDAYTRVWRPYFYAAVVYSSINEDYNYAFEGGIGGKVFQQDHLSIGALYSEYIKGINDKVIQFYMRYQFLYFHP